MKPHTLFLALSIASIGTANAATTCSRANLTRCLDSACALNLSANPAARCQYCGTSSAGEPKTPKGMRSVSVGASAKYNISDKDLKNAPTDPGERYAWATSQCIKKVTGCTTDDVTDTYDTLIEQSCKAAGVSAKMNRALETAFDTKSRSACESEIQLCIFADNHCTSDFRKCESNTDFDKFFSSCSVSVSGCDEHISEIRGELLATRDSVIKNADTLLAKIVAGYSAARENKIAEIKSGCAEKRFYESCIETVCKNNMNNQCGADFEFEKTMAIQLCKFYDTACATID